MACFTVPRQTYHGPGSLKNLKEVTGKKAVIIIGGGSMKREGFLDKTIALLKEAGIESAVFEGVESDPSVDTVMRGVAFFNEEKPDLVIGLGGCSAIDAAKAMWVFYEHPDATFEEITQPFTIKPLRSKARFVAIPSTSGTVMLAALPLIVGVQFVLAFLSYDLQNVPREAIHRRLEPRDAEPSGS